MICVKDITMDFGLTKALNNVSFTANRNEILGLLGPNGAGKTTTMRILTTYLTPTSGSAEIAGYDVQKFPIKIRKLLGYLPESTPLYYELEAIEYLDFVGRSRGLSGKKLKTRLEWVIDACQIKEILKRPIQELSKGYRQRVGLAQALIHDPAALILDEPTSGLDPLQIREIRSLIKKLSYEKTIIFSTHILQEVEAISDRVCIINEGKIIANGKISEFKKKTGEFRKFEVELQAPQEELEKFLGVLSIVKRYFVKKLSDTSSRATIEIDKEAESQFYLEFNRKGWTIKEFKEVLPTFEETFIALIKESQEKSK